MNVKPKRMIRHLVIALICCLHAPAEAQDATFYFNEAKKAASEKQYLRYDSLVQKALSLFPYHPVILWHAGKAAALNNNTEASLVYLGKAINMRADFDLHDKDLEVLMNTAGHEKLLQLKETLMKPVINSDTAFTLRDRQLHLESVAFDPVDQALFGGSIHKRKIIRIAASGDVTDFTREMQHEMGAVFGLKVDVRKRYLWACSSPMKEMQHYDSALRSAVHQFDLSTGTLLQVYYPDDSLQNHVFGDVVLNARGVPFVSDSRNNIIYTLDAEGRRLVPYFTSKEFWNIQGLAFSNNDKMLYISDYIKGIYVLNTRTMALSKMTVPYDLSLIGSDGIHVYGNSLITIQNGVQPNRVVRHFLDRSGTAFLSYRYVDNAHPAFGEPTIGSLDGDTFYYVANSQWNGYEHGQIKEWWGLQPVIILKHVFRDERKRKGVKE